MSDPGMEFPKPADFNEQGPRRPARLTAERMIVLGLLLAGGLFLGLAVELWPDTDPVAALWGQVQNVIQDPKEDLKNSILQRFQAGDVEQAILLCDKLIELDAPLGYSLRAQIHDETDQPEKALADCAKLIEVDPSQGYTLRGKIYFDDKKYDEAAADFTKLIEADPKDADGYRLRAVCRLQAKKYDEALADSVEIQKLEPVIGYILEGQIHEEKNDLAKAVEVYGKALEKEPKDARLISRRYQANLKRGASEEAVKDAEKLIDVEPAQGYILKGDALAKGGKSDEAIEAYGSALGHDPNNATALNNRAYHRALTKKDLVEASKDVAEAIEIGGEQPAFVDTRGYISYLRGDFKQALADFNQALRDAEGEGVDPSFSAEIYFHRGLVYNKLGEKELSEQDFTKAKELGFESKDRPEPVEGKL